MENQKEKKYLRNNTKLMAEWDYEKNCNLNLHTLTSGSQKKAWWKCYTCGYEWQATIGSRSINGRGCPACANKSRSKKAKTQYSKETQSLYQWCYTNKRIDLLEEWDTEKNVDITPKDVAHASGKKVWWKCKVCGNSWLARIAGRSNTCGCPFCSSQKLLSGYNDFETWCNKEQKIELLSEWNHKKNGELTPDKAMRASNKKVWWKCKTCGHEWQAKILSRYIGQGCPKCSSILSFSFPEKAVFYYVKELFPSAQENYKPNWLYPGELDIYIPDLRLGIEYDGQQWHNDINRDKIKDEKCKQNNVVLWRIREPEAPIIKSCSTCFILADTTLKSLEDCIKVIATKILKYSNKNEIDVDIERDSKNINELLEYQIKENSLYNWCMVNQRQDLLEEWDKLENGTLTPEKITWGTNKKVWWKCSLGHKWQARISSRSIDRQKCPFCTNAKILPGFNDFETWCLNSEHKYLLKEWDKNRNIGINPKDFGRTSKKIVWWKCMDNGKEWQASIRSRSKGQRCRHCTHKNDTDL